MLVATLYFFGQQFFEYKHYFQHTGLLIPRSSYPEFAVFSVEPLFTYVIGAQIYSGFLDL